MDRLDGIDEQILAELAQHARATFAEIGERVNLSAPAVKRRVDRMLDSGVIRGFTTVIDRSAVGWNTEAYVQVYCQGRISPDELRRAWIDIPEVVSAATATGTADAILRVLAHDMRHLEDALERIRTSADVDRTESIVVTADASMLDAQDATLGSTVSGDVLKDLPLTADGGRDARNFARSVVATYSTVTGPQLGYNNSVAGSQLT